MAMLKTFRVLAKNRVIVEDFKIGCYVKNAKFSYLFLQKSVGICKLNFQKSIVGPFASYKFKNLELKWKLSYD
jgi:hypothetical protein